MHKVENNLTIAQFAAKLGVTVPTVRSYVKAGKIVPTLVCGSHLYFAEELVYKYAGIFVGKKRGTTNKVENFAVLCIAKTNEDIVSKEQIDIAMQKTGIDSLENYDIEREIQPDELDDFQKFCESKSFSIILSQRVADAKSKKKKQLCSSSQAEAFRELEKIYNSEEYSSRKKLLEGGKLSDEMREKISNEIKEIDDAIEQGKKDISTNENKKLEEINNAYSSEYIDELGNISADAPEGSGVEYVKIFKSLWDKYVRDYRMARYSSLKQYVTFNIFTEDVETFETPLSNIINKAYDKVFLVNKDNLNKEWQKVFDVINKIGVSEVEELLIE